jgi:hypothetical protein
MHPAQSIAVCLALLGPGKFDPANQLPGWNESHSSKKYSYLYHFEEFEGPKDRDPTPAEVADLQRRWDEERKRVAQEIARRESDPQAKFIDRVREQFETIGCFHSINYETFERAGLTIFVQESPGERKNVAKSVEGYYRPWVEQLICHFDKVYAKPLELARRPDLPSLALIALLDRADYERYRQAIGQPADASEVANYDPFLHLSVTYQPGKLADAARESEQLHRVLHELVHALTDAYAPKGIAAMQRPWLEEGLAEFVGSYSGRPGGETPLLFGARSFVAEGNYRRIREMPRIGDVLLTPLSDLLAATDYDDVRARAERRGTAQGVTLVGDSAKLVLPAFYVTAHLFVRFLHDDDGGRWRSGFLAYFKAALNGESGPDVFQKALGLSSLGDLEEAFRKYLDPIDRPSSVTVKPRPTPPLPRPPAPPLRLDIGASAAAQWRALLRAKAGDVFGGLSALRDAEGDPNDVSFLEALAKLSDDVLDVTRREGKLLPIDGHGSGLVKSFDANELVILDYKGKEIRLPRSAFGVGALVDRIRSKQLALGKPETLASALVLVGKSVDEATKHWPAAKDAVQSKSDRWATLAREAEAQARLVCVALVHSGIASASDPKAPLRNVDALLLDLRGTKTSAANREALVELGSRLLEREFDATDAILGAFHVRGKRLSDGSLELPYDFLSPSQREDWQEDRTYAEALLRNCHQRMPPIDTPANWRVENGKLVAVGFSGWFHVARFDGPASIEYTQVYAGGSQSAERPGVLLTVVCDDGHLSNGLARFGQLLRRFNATTPAEWTNPEFVVPTDLITRHPYAYRLVHVGHEFVSSGDGVPAAKVDDAGVECGRFGFVGIGEIQHEISNLIIRGTLDVSWVDERRAAWVAKRRALWNGEPSSEPAAK